MSEGNSDVMFAEERQAAIVRMVQERGKVLVPDLVAFFKMSPATIRGDLRDLEARGLIKRTHGGAIPSDAAPVGFELDNKGKTVKDLSLKEAIAKKAAELVEDGDIIILDAGLTTREMCGHLQHKKNLTVIVNDIEIASLLERLDNVSVVVIGGMLRRHFHCTVGPFAVKLLSELNVDKVFLGTNAFSARKGCTTPDMNQAEVKRTMIRIATQVVLLCDSAKIGKNSFVQFAEPGEIDLVITDSRITGQHLREMTEAGMEVMVEQVR
ncbi:DeoR/GlpR family DNA-binding transcription regulator [Cohnella sp. GCM10020058]|uniref:DeoR/GlpR family DNA-binding transcription regulator n=1 Tax=Cohnella sp. GCM10020058 TaxID=3317330 RepID=UPI0036429AD0